MIDKAVILYLEGGTYTYFDPDKLYPIGQVPQLTETPYAFYRINNIETMTSKGNTSHIDEAIFRINVVSNLISTCWNIEDEIRTRLDGVVNQLSGGINIRQIDFIDFSYIWNDSYDAYEFVIDYLVKIDK